MQLKCIVCEHEPEPSEIYYQIESWCKSDRGSRQGISACVCYKHIATEINNKLGVTNSAGFITHDKQTEWEADFYKS